MKTIKNGDKIKRVTDEEAHNLVSASFTSWEYCSKAEWKAIRGAAKGPAKEEAVKKTRPSKKEIKATKKANK